MKLVVGLGNPGRRYQATRHNVGFVAAAKLARLVAADAIRNRFEGEFAEGQCDGEKLAILCPETYMNASGRSVRRAAEFFKLDPADVLVLCDDFNLPLARLRIRAKGSSGGQKGLADVIRALGTDVVPRVRIGIGSAPDGWAVADYVLSKFGKHEVPDIELATDQAANAAVDWARHGIEYCMNQYNRSE